MDALEWLNVTACVAAFVALAYLVLSPTVNDGIVIKLGLVAAALGELGVAMVLLSDRWQPYRPLMWCLAAVHVGLATVLVGTAWRLARNPDARQIVQAATGWPPFNSNEVNT